MNSYEFCAQWVCDQIPEKNASVLDYGCGAGQIVKELRNQDVNAFGCDVFYEGGDHSKSIAPNLFDEDIIKKMDGGTIPFGDASFDFITNNQVMEHVENLDSVLAEIRRVLKPGGVVLSLFPEKGQWREGHCGIPFLHWFPKNNRTRVYYATVFRILGFGHHKGTKSAISWSRDFCEWLDKWTYYRSYQEIHSTYSKYFCDIQHIEDYWIKQRKPLLDRLPASIKKLICHKLGSMVFVAGKPV